MQSNEIFRLTIVESSFWYIETFVALLSVNFNTDINLLSVNQFARCLSFSYHHIRFPIPFVVCFLGTPITSSPLYTVLGTGKWSWILQHRSELFERLVSISKKILVQLCYSSLLTRIRYWIYSKRINEFPTIFVKI